MAKNGWGSVLAAVADACAGQDGCCACVEEGEPCCMTDQAREVFKQMEKAGGPSLDQCEAIARGELVVAPVMTAEQQEGTGT